MEGERNCRIIRPAGALFQADIFLAERAGAEGFTKQLALWKVRPELCKRPGGVAALHRDLKLAGQISSAQVTHVLDVWHADDVFTVAVEHLSGLTLAQATRRAAELGTFMPIEVALAAALEAARALEVAHDPGSPGGPVVHGDIRPEIVILGKQGTVKLTGFGFASFLPTVSPNGEFCVWDGWCYQPPERLRSTDLDPRSDIFSLGTVLLEAATGGRPYGASDPGELRRRLEAGSSPVPESGVDLPDDVGEVVRRACAPSPADRYQSAGDLAEALQGLLFERRRTGTSGGLVRLFLDELSSDAKHDAEGEDDTTVASRNQPGAMASLMVSVREPNAFPPRVEAPRTKLVGRTDVLRIVSQALAGTARGAGMAIMLVGQPGMGRTRILTEVALRLSSSDKRRAWLHVKARPSEHAVKWSGVLRLLAPLVGLGPECELGQIGRSAGQLKAFGLDEAMIEVVEGVAGQYPLADPASATRLLGRAVKTCITSIAQEQTTIVAWDDLQWTDDASLSCVGELVAEIPVLSVLALLTASEGFCSPWPPGTIYPIHLDPLGIAECEDLILERFPGAEAVDAELLDAIQLHTLNNPLAVEETLDLLEQSGRLSVEGATLGLSGRPGEPLPRLEDAVRARLRETSSDVLEVAVAAALAGPAISEHVVATATGRALQAVQTALVALAEEHGLLRRGDAELEFVHERGRRAVLTAAPEALVSAMREPTARAILASTAPMVGLDHVVASLLTDAGSVGSAAEVVLAAARASEAADDPEGALWRYQRALELVRRSGGGDGALELRLCLGIGRVAALSLRIDLAESSLLEAIELAGERGDTEAGAEAGIVMLRLLARQGRLQDVMERAKDTIPLVESTGDLLLLARAYGAIGEAYQQFGQFGPDLRYIEAAVSFAAESGDSSQLARFLQLAVIHAAATGELEQTRILLDQARRTTDASGDPRLRGHLLEAETLRTTFAGDFEAAIATSLEGVDLARRHGLHELELVMLHWAGSGALRRDRHREALASLRESLRRSRVARDDRLTELNEMHVGYIEVAHLDQPDGLVKVRRALEQAGGQGRTWNLYHAHLLMGRCLLAQAEQGVDHHIEEALRLARESGVRFFIEEAMSWLLKVKGTPGE
jgi:serine/threonine-protein kinase